MERGLDARDSTPGRWRRSASTPGASTTACSTIAASWWNHRSRIATPAPHGYRAVLERIGADALLRDHRAAGPADRHDLPARRPRPRTARAGASAADAPGAARPPSDRRGRPPSTRRRARPGCSTCTPATWSAELADAVGVPIVAAPAAATGGNAGREVARCPGAPRRRARHRVGGAGRRPRRRAVRVDGHVAARRAANGLRPTRRTRHSPPGSATSTARSAASGSCATSPAGGSSRSAAASGAIRDLDGLLAAAAALEAGCPSSTRSTTALPRARRHGRRARRLADLARRDRSCRGRRAARSSRWRRRPRRCSRRFPSTDAVPTRSLRVFGGGTRSPLLLDALRRRTIARDQSVGPVEAAALGQRARPGRSPSGCSRHVDDAACDTRRPARRIVR